MLETNKVMSVSKGECVYSCSAASRRLSDPSSGTSHVFWVSLLSRPIESYRTTLGRHSWSCTLKKWRKSSREKLNPSVLLLLLHSWPILVEWVWLSILWSYEKLSDPQKKVSDTVRQSREAFCLKHAEALQHRQVFHGCDFDCFWTCTATSSLQDYTVDTEHRRCSANSKRLSSLCSVTKQELPHIAWQWIMSPCTGEAVNKYQVLEWIFWKETLQKQSTVSLGKPTKLEPDVPMTEPLNRRRNKCKKYLTGRTKSNSLRGETDK